MAENVLGLVLRQHGCLFFDHISVIRRAVLKKKVFCVAIFMDGSERYCSKIIRAVLE